MFGGTASVFAGLLLLGTPRVSVPEVGVPSANETEIAGQIDALAQAGYRDVTSGAYGVADSMGQAAMAGVGAIGSAVANVSASRAATADPATRLIVVTPGLTATPRPLAATSALPSALPPATPGLAPASAGVVAVGNTGGDGVFLRSAPGSGSRIRAWPDGTRLTVVGEDRQVAGRAWRNVRDPAGNTGWVSAEYLVPAAAPPVAAAPTRGPAATATEIPTRFPATPTRLARTATSTPSGRPTSSPQATPRG